MYPSVILTVTVVGGGGSGLHAAGGGAGGVAIETYYDLLTCFHMTIEVGVPGKGGLEYLGEGGWSTWERGVGVPGRGGLENQ